MFNPNSKKSWAVLALAVLRGIQLGLPKHHRKWAIKTFYNLRFRSTFSPTSPLQLPTVVVAWLICAFADGKKL